MLTILSHNVIYACGEGFAYNLESSSPMVLIQKKCMMIVDFGNLSFDIPFTSENYVTIAGQLLDLSKKKDKSRVILVGQDAVLSYTEGSYYLISLGIRIGFDCDPNVFREMADAICFIHSDFFEIHQLWR